MQGSGLLATAIHPAWRGMRGCVPTLYDGRHTLAQRDHRAILSLPTTRRYHELLDQ
jgi:hypothetical protein